MENILKLIEESDDSQFFKMRMKSFVDKANDEIKKHDDDIELIKSVGYVREMFEIVLNSDEFKIYKIINSRHETDKKYPYRLIYLDDKKQWRNCNTASESIDFSLLLYLEYKYTGMNSQFSEFATRMLKM